MSMIFNGLILKNSIVLVQWRKPVQSYQLGSSIHIKIVAI
jgi:hypothetical protein